MKIFLNFLIILFFLIVFIGLYFLMERAKKSDTIVRKNYPKLFINLFEGVTYSFFGLISQVVLYQTHQFAQPYIYIALGLSLIFLRGAVIACYSIVGSMIYSMFVYPIDNVFYYVIAIMFISMALTSVVRPFIKTRLSILFNSIFLLTNVFVLWAVASLGLNYQFTVQFILATLLPFLLSIFLIVIVSYLLTFLRSANLLYESSTYDILKYYRESIAENAIREFIVANKTSKAFFSVLEFQWSKDVSDKKREFEIQALEKIQKIIGKNAVLFKINRDQYGFFLPVELKVDLQESITANKNKRRESSDAIIHIEKLLKEVSGEYRLEQRQAKLNLRAGVVMYGIQEQEINKMQILSEFALEYSRWNNGWNNAVLFDPKVYKRRASDYQAIRTMDNSIGLLSISNEFMPVFDLNKKSTVMNVASPITTDVLDADYNSIEEYAEYMGYKSILLSYNAAQALKISNGWRKTPLVVYYSLEKITSPSFNLEELIASFKRFKQTNKNVILSFNAKNINEYNSKTLIQISKKLKENKIRFSFFNFTINEHVKTIARMKPEYIFLDKSLYQGKILSRFNSTLIDEVLKFAKVIKTKIIVSDIQKERELKFILSTGIKLISGPIFNRNEIEPLLFNKKSKIYIEQIQKEEK